MRHTKENYSYLDEDICSNEPREKLYDTQNPLFYNNQELASPKQKEKTHKRPNDCKWYQKVFSRREQ